MQRQCRSTSTRKKCPSLRAPSQKNQSPDPAPMNRRLAFILMFAMLGPGCMRAGTDYVRPKATLPSAFDEAGPWKETAPSDEVIRAKWWEIYGDPVLNRLEEQARESSPRVEAAAARVDQARAVLGFNKAGRYPTVVFTPSGQRFRTSGNRVDQPSKL